MSDLIYDDVIVHHICEEDVGGPGKQLLRVQKINQSYSRLASGDHVTSGILFKDDFDSSSLDTLW